MRKNLWGGWRIGFALLSRSLNLEYSCLICGVCAADPGMLYSYNPYLLHLSKDKIIIICHLYCIIVP